MYACINLCTCVLGMCVFVVLCVRVGGVCVCVCVIGFLQTCINQI